MVVSSSDQTRSVDMDSNLSPNFLDSLTASGNPISQFNPLFVCPTPPDSERSANTPSPGEVQTGPTSSDLSGGAQNGLISSGLPGGAQNGLNLGGFSGGVQSGPISRGPTGAFQNGPTSSVLSANNFNCLPVPVSSPMTSSAAIPAPGRYLPSDTLNRDHVLSRSLPAGRLEVERRAATRKPQLTSARSNEASIKILNPKPEYDKVQKKHGPRGKFSEQRIQNGQVWVKCKAVGKKRVPFSFSLILNANEMHALCDRHQKVSLLIKAYQN